MKEYTQRLQENARQLMVESARQFSRMARKRKEYREKKKQKKLEKQRELEEEKANEDRYKRQQVCWCRRVYVAH